MRELNQCFWLYPEHLLFYKEALKISENHPFKFVLQLWDKQLQKKQNWQITKATNLFCHYNTFYLWAFSWYSMSDIYFCQAPFVEERLKAFSLPVESNYTEIQYSFICIWLRKRIFWEIFHTMTRQKFWLNTLWKGKQRYRFRHATFSHVQAQWVKSQYCESLASLLEGHKGTWFHVSNIPPT